MNTVKLIFTLILFILLLDTVQMLGSEVVDDFLFETKSITSDEGKIEYLITTSIKLEKLNSSLSLDAIKQAYKLSVEIENKELIAKCNNQMGIILLKRDKTDEALKFLKEALAYYKGLNNDIVSAFVLVNIGDTYFNSHQYTKSLLYYNSAIVGFNDVNDSVNITRCYTLIGTSNLKLGNNVEAIRFFKDAIGIAKRNHYDFYIVFNYLKLSNIQLFNNIGNSIVNQLDLALSIAKKKQYTDLISEAYLSYADYYFAIDNKIEAIKYMQFFINYNDSITKKNCNELDIYLNDLSHQDTKYNWLNKMKYGFWIFITGFIIVILILLYKIINRRATYQDQNNIIELELDAFKANTGNLTEIINQKTKDRIIEIESEIAENKINKLALNNSLINLKDVNNLKDIFLSKISHQIRTPLSGILGFSEILETELVLMEDPTLFEFANSISQSGQSLVTLLNNILDISRLDSNIMTLDFKRINTKELIQGVVDTYYKESDLKGVKLIYASEDIPDIYTDSYLLSKIISLIISNSLKFTEKGFIKISHAYDDKNEKIVILIKDTGIGIDKVYIDKVFEPFRQESLGYSVSYQGAGLGLPLAKKMTLKLNGTIEIESEKGSGTTIILTFPAFVKNTVADIKSNNFELKEGKQIKVFPWDSLSILVVEDDNLNQILYRKLLATAHYLEVVKDGKTALSVVEKQVVKGNFQLVLMDINLPIPWDGISLMKEIRARWPEYKKIPFVAQTAYAISGNRDTMLSEGFDEYITKPIIKSILVDTINRAV